MIKKLSFAPIFIALLTSFYACQPKKPKVERWEYEVEHQYTADTLQGNYIPKDLNDCFIQIDKLWNDSTKNAVKKMSEEDFWMSRYSNFGMYMRNNWRIWGGSRLSKYFNDYGVYNAERISVVILISYHRYLLGKPIRFEDEVMKEHKYWREGTRPIKDSFPKEAGNIKFYAELSHTKIESGQHYVHITKADRPGKYTWIYDDNKGWGKITKAELRDLKLAEKNRDSVLAILKKKGRFLKN